MNLKFHWEGGLARCSVPPAPVCSACDDMGVVSREVDGVWIAGRCRCRLAHDRARLFNDAQIPARFARASFATWRTDTGARAAYTGVQVWTRAFAAGKEQRGLLLCGEPGRGKTHLLVSVARSLMLDHGLGVRFVEFGHLLSGLKARMGGDKSETPESMLKPLVECDVLVLDELGGGRAGGPTEWEASIAELLVTQRYNSARPMLCASNFRPAAQGRGSLGERLGERVWSRVREASLVIPVMGEDFRLARAGGAA